MKRARRSAQHAPLRRTKRGSSAALLLVDWFSPWEFPERDDVLAHALPAARVAARMLARARAAAVPVIYANDHFGQWRSDFRAVVATARQAGDAPAEIAALMAPVDTDHFVLKPKHSAFHATPLDLLLGHLETRVLVVAGIAGNQCVLATALDARMHDYDVVAVEDASASASAALHRGACEQMRAFGVQVSPGRAIHWSRWE